MWFNLFVGILYCNKDPVLRQVEVTRNGETKTVYCLSFWGTNRLKWAVRYLNTGQWVEYWSDYPPWQHNVMRKGVPILVSGQALSRVNKPTLEHQDEPMARHFSFIRAKHLIPLNPRPQDDPEAMVVRRSSFVHLYEFAKQHGYAPHRQPNVNKGGARNDQDELDPEIEQLFRPEPPEPTDDPSPL